jgi:hypothetical protein
MKTNTFAHAFKTPLGNYLEINQDRFEDLYSAVINPCQIVDGHCIIERDHNGKIVTEYSIRGDIIEIFD